MESKDRAKVRGQGGKPEPVFIIQTGQERYGLGMGCRPVTERKWFPSLENLSEPQAPAKAPPTSQSFPGVQRDSQAFLSISPSNKCSSD